MMTAWKHIADGCLIDGSIAALCDCFQRIARAKPETVWLMETADFVGAPGDWTLIDVNHADTTSVSTHSGSILQVSQYLSVLTGARSHLLAIQPDFIGRHGGLIPSVAETVDQIGRLLLQSFSIDRGHQPNRTELRR